MNIEIFLACTDHRRYCRIFRTVEILNQDIISESFEVYFCTVIPVFDLAFILDFFILNMTGFIYTSAI